MSARPLPVPVNPALLKHADQRRQHLENRIADQITRFAGSMLFVYLHIIGPSTPSTPPGRPPAETAANSYGSRPKQSAAPAGARSITEHELAPASGPPTRA